MFSFFSSFVLFQRPLSKLVICNLELCKESVEAAGADDVFAALHMNQRKK
jgi:hypothetical protein